MRHIVSRHAFVGIALAIGLGFGCGGGNGCGGLGGLTPLPSEPAPWGFPGDQTIEGGLQARITKPGFEKISSLIPALAASALPTQQKPICFGPQNFSLTIAGTGAKADMCNASCGNGGTGCPVWVDLRPDIAPPGGIAVSMADGTNPVVDIDAAFDVHMRVPLRYQLCAFGFCTGWNDVCTAAVDAPGTHILAGIQLGTDPATGKLTIQLNGVQLKDLNLSLNDCGIISDLLNFVLNIIDTVATSFIGDTLIKLIQPQLSKLIAGFLPDPLGLIGSISTAQMLASYDPPKTAALEALLVPGGYVSAKSGGLNLGVIAGINSDRDPTTRGPGQTSDPSLCVPARQPIDVGQPPWNIPPQGTRPTHALAAADPFAGTPDPVDANGNVEDLAIGVSRSFLDIAGFHIFNSGTLCLSVSGGILSQLNAGTISILVPSLNNILENKKAPIAISLRPEEPLRFTIGSGTTDDPLLRVQVTDLRADFYTFLEDRYVRIFTLALDLNVGLNLAITMDANGKPAIAPTISGIDAMNVQARVSNTDLLKEDPTKLAKSLLGLINVAVGQLGGAIKPISLPSLMGFSLDGLQITRVQSPEDDFLAIFGSLAQDPNGMPLSLPRTKVPYEKVPSPIDTTAQVAEVSTPPIEVIRAAAANGEITGGNLPTVRLALGSSASGAEWSYRVNGGIWHAWSSDPRPTISDASFLLQAHHTIEVRSRVKGDWSTEDQTPVALDVVIDSVPPTLSPRVEGGELVFGGDDNVTPPEAIKYAWRTPAGRTEPGLRAHLGLEEAWAATSRGKTPLTIFGIDEQGNETAYDLPLSSLNEFHGRETMPASSSGCGCAVGARRAPDPLALFAFLSLLGLVALRRSRIRE